MKHSSHKSHFQTLFCWSTLWICPLNPSLLLRFLLSLSTCPNSFTPFPPSFYSLFGVSSSVPLCWFLIQYCAKITETLPQVSSHEKLMFCWWTSRSFFKFFSFLFFKESKAYAQLTCFLTVVLLLFLLLIHGSRNVFVWHTPLTVIICANRPQNLQYLLCQNCSSF